MSSGRVEVLPPVKAGSRVEGNVLQRVPELSYVPDRTARWYDAHVTTRLEPRPELPFVGVDVLDEGDRVEIKGAQLVLSSGCAGRIYVRQGQHEEVHSKNAHYLVAVYDPSRSLEIVVMVVIAADVLDHLKPDGWIDVEADRSEDGYRQLAWTNFFDADVVGELASAADALHDVLDDRRVFVPASGRRSAHYHAVESCAARGRGRADEVLLERAAKEGFDSCGICADEMEFALSMETGGVA